MSNRLITRISQVSGDRTLHNPQKANLTVVEDNFDLVTGMLQRIIPNTSGSNVVTLDFTELGFARVAHIFAYCTAPLTMQFNASGDTYPLTPPLYLPGGQVNDFDLQLAAYLNWRTDNLTSLVLTNSGTGSATFHYSLGGYTS